jgi:hypothetical protein
LQRTQECTASTSVSERVHSILFLFLFPQPRLFPAGLLIDIYPNPTLALEFVKFILRKILRVFATLGAVRLGSPFFRIE